MEELLKEIFRLLTEKFKTFDHFKVEQKTIDFPYVTMNVPSGNPVFTNYQLEDFVLDIDVWDIGDSNLLVEQMTDEIVTLLDRRKTYFKNRLQACFYLTNRLKVDDPRPEINRRQLTFQVRTYLLKIKKEEIL